MKEHTLNRRFEAIGLISRSLTAGALPTTFARYRLHLACWQRSTEALKAWLQAANISEGWLFRRVNSGRAGTDALHPHSIGRILKQRAIAAGLPAEIVNRISGHSMRVGAAQDMMANGADILPIMRSGGWKSINVVARYVQSVELVKLASWRR